MDDTFPDVFATYNLLRTFPLSPSVEVCCSFTSFIDTLFNGDFSRDESHESARGIVSANARRDVRVDAGPLGPLPPAAHAIARPMACPRDNPDQGGFRPGVV